MRLPASSPDCCPQVTMLELPLASWLLLLLGGFTVGMSKSGLAGVGLVQVLAFAVVFGARQ